MMTSKQTWGILASVMTIETIAFLAINTYVLGCIYGACTALSFWAFFSSDRQSI